MDTTITAQHTNGDDDEIKPYTKKKKTHAKLKIEGAGKKGPVKESNL